MSLGAARLARGRPGLGAGSFRFRGPRFRGGCHGGGGRWFHVVRTLFLFWSLVTAGRLRLPCQSRGARLGRAGRSEKRLGECGGYMESLRPGPGQEANFFLRLITWFGSASSTRGNEISHGGPPRAAGESKERGKERGVSPSFYG